MSVIWRYSEVKDRCCWYFAYFQYWLATMFLWLARKSCGYVVGARYKSFLWSAVYPPSVVKKLECDGVDLFETVISSMRMTAYLNRINKVSGDLGELLVDYNDAKVEKSIAQA